jgi:hypothetical protein
VRELVRAIQEFRKQSGLTPSHAPALSVTTDAGGVELVAMFKEHIMKAANLSGIVAIAGEHGDDRYAFELR